MRNLEGWGVQKHYNNYPPLIPAVDKVRIVTHDNELTPVKWTITYLFLLQLYYKAQSSEPFCELRLLLILLYLVPEGFPRKLGLLLEGHHMPFSFPD